MASPVNYRLQGPPQDGDMEQWSAANKQWVLTTAPTGGTSTVNYASLTGPGQTTTPGNLTQAGGFTVNDTSGSGVFVNDYTGNGINFLSTNIGPGNNGFIVTTDGFYIHDNSSAGATTSTIISDNNKVQVTSQGLALQSNDGTGAGPYIGVQITSPGTNGSIVIATGNISTSALGSASVCGQSVILGYNGLGVAIADMANAGHPTPRIFTWNGTPVGHVTAQHAGDLCIDTTTPGLWMWSGAAWTMYTNP
jgi:hypothetical protein